MKVIFIENPPKSIKSPEDLEPIWIELVNDMNNFSKKSSIIFYLFFDKNYKLCVLDFSYFEKHKDILEKHIDEIINSFVVRFPDTTFWTYVEFKDKKFEEKCLKLVQDGFRHPFVTTKKPFGREMELSLALMKKFTKNNFSMDV